jgi:CspA family cold shock protein
MAQGTVKWFNPEKGLRLHHPDGGGPDVFVPNRTPCQPSLLGDPGRRLPLVGGNQKVSYTVTQGNKGPQATAVTPSDPRTLDEPTKRTRPGAQRPSRRELSPQ